LYLGNNKVGDYGAQYLGEALQQNTVSQNQSIHFEDVHLLYFIQALILLDLDKNQIGDKGAQYLGEGLKKNKVRQEHSLHL